MDLARVDRGDSALVIDVPHAGTFVPADIAARLAPAARALPDTDWHVDRLYAFARATGATLVVATHARYVVDLNRDPSGAALYPGADNSEILPTTTFDRAPVYEGSTPDGEEIADRVARYHAPYHARLAAEVERVRARHGYAILLDGHSIRSRVPRFFDGRLPDLNLGTASGTSAEPALERIATGVLAAAEGMTAVANGRFQGGWITRHYGRPADGVHALQLEVAQAVYMDESPPWRWDAARAAPLGRVLARLVDALLGWRPAGAS